MENGTERNKKKQCVDRILGVPILISLGAKLAALKTFYGWVAIVCIHVDECPASHRHQEERSVMRLLLCRTMRSLQELRAEVAPRAACMSCTPGIVASVGVLEAQYARGRRRPWWSRSKVNPGSPLGQPWIL